MFSTTKRIYLATRKKNDQVFNTYFMRPIAAFVVSIVARTPVTPNQLTIWNLFVFVGASALFVALPTHVGGILAVGALEFSYLFDCADGMLARHKQLASKAGHLFDFFTDEMKAVLLISSLGLRAYRTGGLGIDLSAWPAGDVRFLFGALAGACVIASAVSMTNFLRRPELSGKETPVEAHYETVANRYPTSLVGWIGWSVTTFLRFLNHYPSHIWIFAVAGRLEVFFWVYGAINLLYLGRGWLGILLRFGRS